MARSQYPKPKAEVFLSYGPGSMYDWFAIVDGPAAPQAGDTIMVRWMEPSRKGLRVKRDYGAVVLKVAYRTPLGLKCDYVRSANAGDRLPGGHEVKGGEG